MRIVIETIRLGASLAGIHSLATAIAILRSMFTVAVLLSVSIASAANIASVTETANGGCVVVYDDGACETVPPSRFVGRDGAPQPPVPPGPDDPEPPPDNETGAFGFQSLSRRWAQEHVTVNRQAETKQVAQAYAAVQKFLIEPHGARVGPKVIVDAQNQANQMLLSNGDITQQWAPWFTKHNQRLKELFDAGKAVTHADYSAIWGSTIDGLNSGLAAEARVDVERLDIGAIFAIIQLILKLLTDLGII